MLSPSESGLKGYSTDWADKAPTEKSEHRRMPQCLKDLKFMGKWIEGKSTGFPVSTIK